MDRIVNVAIASKLLHSTPEWNLYKTKKSVEFLVYCFEVLEQPMRNKQYPTLAAIYFRTVYDNASDECCSFPYAFKNFPDSEARKAKTLSSNMYVTHFWVTIQR